MVVRGQHLSERDWDVILMDMRGNRSPSATAKDVGTSPATVHNWRKLMRLCQSKDYAALSAINLNRRFVLWAEEKIDGFDVSQLGNIPKDAVLRNPPVRAGRRCGRDNLVAEQFGKLCNLAEAIDKKLAAILEKLSAEGSGENDKIVTALGSLEETILLLTEAVEKVPEGFGAASFEEIGAAVKANRLAIEDVNKRVSRLSVSR